MYKPSSKSHWGEFPELQDKLYKINNVYLYMPPDKRAKIQSIEIDEEEKVEEITLIVKNELVTQTIELMTNTNTINSMMKKYKEDKSYIKPPLKEITLSPETKFCIRRIDRPIRFPFYAPEKKSNFYLGKAESYPDLTKPIALESICKPLSGLLRLKGFDDSTESALIMFIDGVEEFYRCMLDKVDHVLMTEDRHLNKTIDVRTLEKAYTQLFGSSLLHLHNYYKNEVVRRNRAEVIKFIKTYEAYEKLREESENVSNIMLKQEYESIIIGGCESKHMSPESSNLNDSHTSSFTYRDSSHSYGRQQSDNNYSIY